MNSCEGRIFEGTDFEKFFNCEFLCKCRRSKMKLYRKQGCWIHGLKPTVFKQLNQVKGKLYEPDI